jgi:hypothetical protein
MMKDGGYDIAAIEDRKEPEVPLLKHPFHTTERDHNKNNS